MTKKTKRPAKKLDPSKCSICQNQIVGHGNSAWPINDGRCCDLCNQLVIAHRIERLNKLLPSVDLP